MSPCRPLTSDGKTISGWLCRAPVQPLTKWRERIELMKGTKIIRHRIPGNRLYRAECCRKKRPAKNLLVSGGGWYDPMFFCQDGKGMQAD